MNIEASKFQIREAMPGDEVGIATIHVQSWQTTYQGIVPQAYLDQLSVDHRIKLWRGLTHASRSDGKTFTALSQKDQIIGFADVGRNRISDPSAGGELNAIYLLKEYQGFGLGKRLFDASRNWLKINDYQTMTLWVLAQNPARDFYSHMGGNVISSKIIELGGIPLEELAFTWNQI